jgi:hypothetical protein
MKKVMIISAVLLLLLAVAGCSIATRAQTKTTTSTGPLNQDYQNALAIPAQLALGTLKLEANLALSAKQATALLPLWKAYRNLSQDSTAAPLEVQALFTQITNTMSKEQLTAISAMKLTSQDIATTLEARGLSATAPSAARGASAGSQPQARQAAGGAGGFPAGGPGGDFMGGPPPGVSSGTSTTKTANSTTATSSTAVNPMLLQALLTVLQSQAQVAK